MATSQHAHIRPRRLIHLVLQWTWLDAGPPRPEDRKSPLHGWVPESTATRREVHTRAAENIARGRFHTRSSADIVPEAPLHTLDTAN